MALPTFRVDSQVLVSKGAVYYSPEEPDHYSRAGFVMPPQKNYGRDIYAEKSGLRIAVEGRLAWLAASATL